MRYILHKQTKTRRWHNGSVSSYNAIQHLPLALLKSPCGLAVKDLAVFFFRNECYFPLFLNSVCPSCSYLRVYFVKRFFMTIFANVVNAFLTAKRGFPACSTLIKQFPVHKHWSSLKRFMYLCNLLFARLSLLLLRFCSPRRCCLKMDARGRCRSFVSRDVLYRKSTQTKVRKHGDPQHPEVCVHLVCGLEFGPREWPPLCSPTDDKPPRSARFCRSEPRDPSR